uniref:Aldehyde dehydrogenase domain-containing protein n=1 Tax=Chromera velia CCMP2878 TaxID=1169474 RepID=A0A0G4G7F9_9ALVE|eukprot:Cvel_4262.t1-p1 / transcript=Cvel_4262.t1 / gene=Cvel_4262 / organism=Chromera_velia_CCMP2878 / gene_product=Betaine aldehyde dehydrogenase 1, chloroplastic, putative / transcript_product=Betaine aldehyde dehydrogenase 1, chloroplastic, putative / location=Cvel_scaffold184:96501-101823(+) / protein_length=511 / sequence_SO=supercontig / SO=protein_coding / is_pseudo=false
MAGMCVPEDLQKNKPLGLQGKCLFIDNDFVAPDSDDFFDTFDPSTGEVLCKLPNASEAIVDKAFKSCEKARKGWASTPAAERAAVMEKIAELVLKNKERLAAIECWDCGKALRECEVDMDGVADAFKFNAQMALSMEGFNEDKDTPLPDYKVRVQWEPIGVMCLITPWNYPLLMAVQKVAASIGAGCTAVLKPSEYAPLTCIELAQICKEAGLPAGVLNVLTGVGAKTGAAMTKHPLPRKVSFTGSVATGKAIMRSCADTLKAVHLELGGKSPMIVFEDADREATIDWIMTGIFWGAGQVCSATSRVMIQEGIYEDFLKGLQETVGKLKVGPGFAKDTDFGPLVSVQQYEKVLNFLKVAKEEGLRPLVGGTVDRPAEVAGTKGYYVQPAVFVDVPVSSRLWKEEIFGPVVCIRSFKTEEEAVSLANDTEYGLGAAVMTKDLKRARRVTEAIESGTVWENCSQPVLQNQPFGGFKQSGFGKECGREGFMEYLQGKAIFSVQPGYHETTFLKK